MEDLKFASTDEAIQHLADVTGSKIKIAEDNSGVSEEAENFLAFVDDVDSEIKRIDKKSKITSEYDQFSRVDKVEYFIKKRKYSFAFLTDAVSGVRVAASVSKLPGAVLQEAGLKSEIQKPTAKQAAEYIQKLYTLLTEKKSAKEATKAPNQSDEDYTKKLKQRITNLAKKLGKVKVDVYIGTHHGNDRQVDVTIDAMLKDPSKQADDWFAIVSRKLNVQAYDYMGQWKDGKTVFSATLYAKDSTHTAAIKETFNVESDKEPDEAMQEEQNLEEEGSIEIPSYQIPINLQNERFATEEEALQHLADLTGSTIKIASYSLVDVFMERDDMTKTEAEEYLKELKDRVADGEGPEEVLSDEGLEPDYFFDLV